MDPLFFLFFFWTIVNKKEKEKKPLLRWLFNETIKHRHFGYIL